MAGSEKRMWLVFRELYRVFFITLKWDLRLKSLKGCVVKGLLVYFVT